jgi:predicted metalloendopeptidase
MTRTRLPDTEARITQAYFIRESINRELGQIIRDTDNPLITTLLRNWDAAATPPTSLLTMMLATAARDDISTRIGALNRWGIGAPLSIYVQGDPRDHSRCRVFIEEGSPRIGIPEYWLWPEYRRHRAEYSRYVGRLAAVLGLPVILKGLGAEREFADIYPNALERRQRIDMLDWPELLREFSVINWEALFVAAGFPADCLPSLKYNVTSRPFLHHLQRRIRDWSSERWAGWFALSVAQWWAGCSPHGPLRRAWFAYNRQFLQGAVADESPAELRQAIVRTLLPGTLGRLWVRRFCEPGLRRTVGAMVERIRAAAIEAVGRSDWMAPSTRAAAVRKLRAMEIVVGWSDEGAAAESAALSSSDFAENLMALAGASADNNIRLITHPRPGGCRRNSGASPPAFVVNAFYYPEENRFVLPAGILRPPFYDPAASVPANYGAIGATIGHELCHAFDAEGRSYDHRGDRRDWWTAGDDRAYRRRAARVVALFESRQYRGMDVDGRLTLTENIADIGGLEFALAGAAAALGRALTPAELREFFVSYAVSWRAKDRRARARELLATDFHAPPMLRVNHVVRQFDEWYAAFGVPDDCAEAVPPARRIRFFGSAAASRDGKMK